MNIAQHPSKYGKGQVTFENLDELQDFDWHAFPRPRHWLSYLREYGVIPRPDMPHTVTVNDSTIALVQGRIATHAAMTNDGDLASTHDHLAAMYNTMDTYLRHQGGMGSSVATN